jgi:integrase
MAKSKIKVFPLTVSHGAGRVRIRKRANGFFDLTWREMGGNRKTTKTSEKKALAWAEEKAIELDAGSGSRWIHQGEADAMEALRKIAGEEEGAIRRLLDDVRGALAWLDGGKADLTTAARWYAENGPLKVERTTAAAAITRFLAEYQKAPRATLNTFTTELDAFAKRFPHLLLMEVTHEMLAKWCKRPLLKFGVATGEAPAIRTEVNRITTWVTFMNRARDWNLLGSGKHAADLLRKPVLPDEGKQVFSIDQGRRLLEAVAEDVRLLTYSLVAGWIGLRPSEVQRLRWVEPGGIEKGGFDWKGYLHVSARVAGKNSSERFIPLDPRLEGILKRIFEASGKKAGEKVCIHRAREFLSVQARAAGVCATWPPDVLRHSFCSYRIAVVKSLEQVATEADNSPAILKSNYRRPVRHEDGLAWWDLLGFLSENDRAID